ncbi:MAG: hypothetical protein WCI05_17015 [Myxococcales bacterium]
MDSRSTALRQTWKSVPSTSTHGHVKLRGLVVVVNMLMDVGHPTALHVRHAARVARLLRHAFLRRGTHRIDGLLDSFRGRLLDVLGEPHGVRDPNGQLF